LFCLRRRGGLGERTVKHAQVATAVITLRQESAFTQLVQADKISDDLLRDLLGVGAHGISHW
jgi:hypothetical protein